MSVVEFVWEPDPIVYADRLNAVAAGLENRMEPMAAAGAALRMSIHERFETETAPDGTPWEPWAESYVDYAEANNAGILDQTGALREAAESSEAVVVSNDAVFYSTPMLPHYGLAHESGLPGRARPLPQRSFLGLSEESEAVIELNFFEWFERNIDLFVTSTGRIGRRHAIRGGGGQFVTRESAGLDPLE